MRTWLCIIGLALGFMRGAQGTELRITSFEGTGRIVFQEVPGAALYRLEWTTNAALPVWSSGAPGIEAIPPAGGSTLTATVGVSLASCYYRVVAVVTNTPPVELANTFDLSNEDWVVVSYPFRSHVAAPATSSLPFDAAFGNPPGSVRVGDAFPETAIAAPAEHLGNKLAFYGGSLIYDIYLRFSDNVTYPAVVLNDGTQSLYFDAPSPPLNAWQREVVPLSEAGWKVSGSGAVASEATFKVVLSNLIGLYIYTEWNTGPDDTSVDNISMTPP